MFTVRIRSVLGQENQHIEIKVGQFKIYSVVCSLLKYVMKLNTSQYGCGKLICK